MERASRSLDSLEEGPSQICTIRLSGIVSFQILTRISVGILVGSSQMVLLEVGMMEASGL